MREVLLSLRDKPLTLKTFLAAISGVLLLWLPVLLLKLTVVLFAALMTFAALRAIAHGLTRYRGQLKHRDGLALVILLVLLSVLIVVLSTWVDKRLDHYTPGTIMTQTALVIDQMQDKLPSFISNHLPSSVGELKQTISNSLKTHASQLQLAGIHTVRNLGYMLIGLVVGAIAALQLGALPKEEHHPPLVALLRAHFEELLMGFTDVFFAQIRISLINTVLTAIYLLGVLPLMGKPMPMAGTLVLITFIAGLIPVVGNLISNTLIVVMSFADSFGIAMFSLIWLVAIHKLEYFLNAEIIGRKIQAKAWELLVVMLIMESAFGMAGLISAPVMYAQLKAIFARRGWV